MIKECKVTLSNKEVMVVRYDDQEIQMPSNGALYDIGSTVYVKCEKNKFSLSIQDDSYKAVQKTENKKESRDANNVDKRL